ncbi:MAG: M3 family metallopeptidase [Bacteroidales bacterium]|nr:M3 family metallopeptidase [Bacteroidales bacterium]
MKKELLILIVMVFSMFACNEENQKNQQKNDEMNPFFSEYNTKFNVAPFDKIKVAHYLPAFEKGIEEHNKEIDAIVNNPEKPNFKNTIEALEYSGELIKKTGDVFYNMRSSLTSKELQDASAKIIPMLSRHKDEVMLNAQLFERVKAVYNQKDELDLSKEQLKLLDETYKKFKRGGAELLGEDKEKFKKINEELASLTLKFGDNVLAETNNFKLVIDNEKDLAGLPESVKKAALETGKETGNEGKWVFTVQKPSMIPFLTYADNRELRKKLLTAYTTRCNHDNEYDNKAIIAKIINLRVERAHLLGYKTHADYVLEETMAKNPDKVYKLMNQVWEAALPVAKAEAAELQKMIDAEGGNFQLAPWDWWYYAEKLRKQKYDLDEEALRPYFKLENVRDGAFMVANKIFGITFKEIHDVSIYHPDVQSFEVLDKDGSHLGILFMDFYPRECKRVGAWMSEFAGQYKKDGKNISPIITTNFNFTKPSGDKPALLSFEEVSTLFHEFGHALHGLLSNVTYPSLAGTNVARDFVEMPSQIMENWAAEPRVMKIYAKHYKTGEAIPDELIEKLSNSKYFNQGFATVEYMSAAYLDMDLHTLSEPIENMDVNAFEKESMDKIGLIPEIIVRYRMPYFSHITGGYSAGYYSYLWSEVLDADAFQAFKETDIFSAETGQKLRDNVLSKGSTDDPMVLYINFRGHEPSIEALLERKGFKK